MYVDEKQARLLQSIADFISTPGQWVRKAKVLADLRNRQGDEVWSDVEFERVLGEVKAECYAEEKPYKGESHLTVTTDALKIDNLNTFNFF